MWKQKAPFCTSEPDQYKSWVNLWAKKHQNKYSLKSKFFIANKVANQYLYYTLVEGI